jgi:hypothetical protein
MTEEEFNRCTSPEAMLAFMEGTGRVSERQYRLFACGCARRVLSLLRDERSGRAVEVAERFADGGATEQERAEVDAAVHAQAIYDPEADAIHLAWTCAAYASALGATTAAEATAAYAGLARAAEVDARQANAAEAEERAAQACLLREIIGPLPFRTVPIPAPVLAWNSGCVVKLASSIYEERVLPSGALDAGRLLVLADALEEAGLSDQEVLGHLCEQGGVHCRGCWPIDLVLAKE